MKNSPVETVYVGFGVPSEDKISTCKMDVNALQFNTSILWPGNSILLGMGWTGEHPEIDVELQQCRIREV